MQIILILHNIRSIHNVASIFRTADAAGVEPIQKPHSGSDADFSAAARGSDSTYSPSTPSSSAVSPRDENSASHLGKRVSGQAPKIYLTGITPGPLDRLGAVRPQFRKVSLGAEHTIPWAKAKSILRLIRGLRKEKYKIFAVEQAKHSIPYYKIRGIRVHSQIRIALIFGNEVRGLAPSVLKSADAILEIPIRGAMVRQGHHPRRLRCGKESLNVAVAAGVALFGLIYG